MKKTTMVAGLLVLAGAAYAGTSWYVGQQAEAQIRQAVIEANDGFLKTFGRGLDGNGAVLTLKNYQRGWFSSDAVYELSVKYEDNPPVEVSFSDHLQHGPFPLVSLKAGNFTPMLAHSQAQLLPMAKIQPWFDSQKDIAPVHASTQIHFGGKGRTVVTFAPVNYAADGETLNFSGGAITIDFTNNFQSSVSNGAFDNLKFVSQEEEESIELNGLVINNSTTKVDQRISTESVATIAKLMLTGEEDVRLEQLQATVHSVQQNDMLEGSVNYDIKKTFVDEVNFGGFELMASVAKLDVAALSDLIETYDRIEQKNGGDDLSDKQEALLQKKLMVLLAAKPEVSIKPLSWSNAAGTSTAGIAVNLIQPSDLAAALDDPFSALTQMLQKVKLDVNLSRAMFMRTLENIGEQSGEPIEASVGEMLYEEYTGSFEEMGLIKLNPEGATLDLLYENGEIVLNGEQMSVENFMMLVMLLAM